MVEKSGFIKLIDMGTAKFMSKKNSRTFTMLGTPHYMAPEILTGKGFNINSNIYLGYSISADYFTIGIIMYEMLCAIYPYGNDFDDPFESLFFCS